MDMNKLKSKLVENLNSNRSQAETSASPASGDSEHSSEPLQKQTSVDHSKQASPKAEQVAPPSFADDPVDSFLHPLRVWPD